MAPTPRTEMRRQPQMPRGQRRVDAILRAAVAVFDAKGYEAATTNAIARRARASIGSLYQFFPNKEAILQAVVTRHRAEMAELFGRLITAETLRLPTSVIVDNVIDGSADFIDTHVGFGRIFWHSPASPRLAAIAAQLDDEIIDRVDAGLALRYPHLSARRRRLHAAITVTMLKALLALADSSPARERSLVLAEVKSVLSHYLDQIDAS